MLSNCCFVQACFCLLTLSAYPVLLCFLHCLLNPPVCFPVRFCSSASYRLFFKSLLSSQRSRTRLVNKLSQVPPVEVLIIGCDRHTEVPVTVGIKTIKGGYSSFLVKFIITREFFFEIKECYSTLIYMKFCHTSNLPELCIYTKDTTAEMALKSAQNTHKRNKISYFRSLMKLFCVRIYLSR